MGEDKLERAEAGTGEQSPENARAEANAAMHVLSDQQKQERKSLRSGGRSGISDWFGRPALCDSSQDKPLTAALNERTLGAHADQVSQPPEVKTHPDGSRTEIIKGESRTEFNKRGQVTEIAYEPPERGTIKATYDKDDNLVSVKDVDGTELRPSGGDWKRYRVKPGEQDKVVDELNDVSFTRDGHLRTVKRNGEIFIRDGGDAVTEHRHEGTKITRNNDNTQVVVEYANGDKAQIKREDLGPMEHNQPTDVTFGKHHLVRQRDGKWIEYDLSGKRVTEWYQVNVTESGEIEMTNKEGGTKVKTVSGKIRWKTPEDPR